MKTIGLIGGISWMSSAEYYRIINEQINARLGGVHAARIIMYSVNYGDIKMLTEQDRWKDISTLITDVAKKIEAAGAECLVIAANTMHRLAPDVRAAISIPLLHIAEVTAKAIHVSGLKKVALLGTKYTMELDFFKDVLSGQGIQTLIPDAPARAYINRAIYEEMGSGLFLPETKAAFISIMQQMKNAGAEGIILGCTEIPLLVKQEEVDLPLFDTTFIHASAAVEFAMKDH